MKKLVFRLFIVLFAVILGACAQATSQPADEMIDPGDKVGDFLITTGDNEGVSFKSKFDCVEESTGKESCKYTVGTKVNVSLGFFDETNSGKLDTIWSEHTDEMVIEGRPVNLQAFGPIDNYHPTVGNMRYWNVVIVTDKPGEITTKHTGVVVGESFEWTTTFTFIAP